MAQLAAISALPHVPGGVGVQCGQEWALQDGAAALPGVWPIHRIHQVGVPERVTQGGGSFGGAAGLHSRSWHRRHIGLVCCSTPLLRREWFRTRKARWSGSVDSLNSGTKPAPSKTFGFESRQVTELGAHHALGDLADDTPVHRFGRKSCCWVTRRAAPGGHCYASAAERRGRSHCRDERRSRRPYAFKGANRLGPSRAPELAYWRVGTPSGPTAPIQCNSNVGMTD